MMKYPALFSTIVLIALALAGCAKDGASSHNWPFAPGPSTLPAANPSIVQQDLMSFADRFSNAIADAYDQAADASTSPQVKEFALGCKVRDVAAVIANAVDDNPMVGLLDMLVLTRLTRMVSEDAWFRDGFGESAARITAAHRRQEGEIWQLAAQYLSAAQLAELRDSIDHWRGEHPDQRYVSLVRLADFSRAKTALTSNGNNPGSIFGLLFLDPLSGLDPAVREVEQSRETAQRMFFYIQRMPTLISWQAELTARRSLGAPQVNSFLGDTSKFTDNTLKFADATRAVADSIKGYPQFITEERQRAIEQASQKITEQRDAAIQQMATVVTTERDAAIKQMATVVTTERDAAIKQIAAAVATERDAAITQATTRASAEGDAVLARFSSLLQSQREQLMRDTGATAKGLIDRILWGEVIVVLISVVAVVIGALTYRRLRPR